MVRAEITPAEWKALRKLALDLETPVQRIVGGLLSDYLRINGYTPKTEKAKRA